MATTKNKTKLTTIKKIMDSDTVAPALSSVGFAKGPQRREETKGLYDLRMDDQGRMTQGIESVSENENESVNEIVNESVVKGGGQRVVGKHRDTVPQPSLAISAGKGVSPASGPGNSAGPAAGQAAAAGRSGPSGVGAAGRAVTERDERDARPGPSGVGAAGRARMVGRGTGAEVDRDPGTTEETAASTLAGRSAERAENTAGKRTAATTALAAGIGDSQNQQKYDKDLTVILELQGTIPVSAMELMRAVRALCGGLVACRATGQRAYEVTLSHIKGKERILDGFKIGETVIHAKGLHNDELVVSFLNLPAYITDEEILAKLESWGVGAVSPIRRRMWPGTKVADGTRFLKVKFNEKVQSLPYSARFETALGPEYFRVIHDRQVKVCRMCLQPGHILRDCPDFFCHKCGVQGHYARECGAKGEGEEDRCGKCKNGVNQCVCNESREEDSNYLAELISASSDSEEEMEQGDPGDRAGVAVRADLARAGPQELGAGQEKPSRRAGVAVRADLARAGPPELKELPARPNQAGPTGSSLDGVAPVSKSGGAEGGSAFGEGEE